MKEGHPVDHNKNPDPIRDLLNDLWYDLWEYPLQFSLDLAKLEGEIGEVHRNRLKAFNTMLTEKKRNPLDPLDFEE